MDTSQVPRAETLARRAPGAVRSGTDGIRTIVWLSGEHDLATRLLIWRQWPMLPSPVPTWSST